MFRFAAALLVAGLSLLIPVRAGEFNKKLSIGDAAPTWSKLEGIDGKAHALADWKDKDVVVIAFSCNNCPVANDHEDRLIALTKKYAPTAESKVAVIAISVDLGPEEKLGKMKERAKEKGYNFACLHDPSQDTGRAYGARVTPAFFVLDKARKLAYMGAMDDSPTGDEIKVKYLDDAIGAVLKGEKPPKAETRPFGCGIEYEKKKE